MSISFHHLVNDEKYDFIHEPALRNVIEKAGRRNIVFVEGYDDKVIYNILFKDYWQKIYFIDTGFTEERISFASKITDTGNCEKVKQYLKNFVQHLPQTKRFYGVIDRDLKTDEEVKEERRNPCYDGRLFIFFERYTLENYFVESEILCDFLRAKSINHKQLIPFLNKGKDNFEKEIITPILSCLTNIAAANLTIHYFNQKVIEQNKSFLEDSISCEEEEIKQRLVHKLNQSLISQEEILSKFSAFQKQIIERNEPLKFASAKTYFSCQFNRKLEEKTKVNLQLNKHKDQLAYILKERWYPNFARDFQDLLSLINPQ